METVKFKRDITKFHEWLDRTLLEWEYRLIEMNPEKREWYDKELARIINRFSDGIQEILDEHEG